MEKQILLVITYSHLISHYFQTADDYLWSIENSFYHEQEYLVKNADTLLNNCPDLTMITLAEICFALESDLQAWFLRTIHEANMTAVRFAIKDITAENLKKIEIKESTCIIYFNWLGFFKVISATS